MSHQATPECPICSSPTEGGPKDHGRAIYFRCETNHEFVIRTTLLARLREVPAPERASLGQQLLARADGFLPLLSNNNGALNVELVKRSNWLSSSGET